MGPKTAQALTIPSPAKAPYGSPPGLLATWPVLPDVDLGPISDFPVTMNPPQDCR